MDAEIRKATAKNLYSITVLTRKFFPYIDMNIDTIFDRMKQGVVYFVALWNGHTIGFVDVEFVGALDAEGRKARAGVRQAKILGLCVLEEFQGKGIGKRLLSTALNEAKKKGAKESVMLVAGDNVKAQNLYSSLGFARKGVLHRKLWGKQIVLMVKTL